MLREPGPHNVIIIVIIMVIIIVIIIVIIVIIIIKIIENNKNSNNSKFILPRSSRSLSLRLRTAASVSSMGALDEEMHGHGCLSRCGFRV